MFYVYKLIHNGNVIYIGFTCDIHRRIKEHTDKVFDSYEFTEFNSKDEALRAESNLIEIHRPEFNITHNPSMVGGLVISPKILLSMRNMTKTEILILLNIETYKTEKNKAWVNSKAVKRICFNVGIEVQTFRNAISSLKRKD